MLVKNHQIVKTKHWIRFTTFKIKTMNFILIVFLIAVALVLYQFIRLHISHVTENNQSSLIIPHKPKKLTEVKFSPKLSIKKEVSAVKKGLIPYVKVAKEKCSKLGYKEDFCWKDVLSVALWETRGKLGCDVIGDSGNSYGCFQIHRGYHPEITIAQAKDFAWSAEWTLKRMMHYGYPIYRSVAIMKHNGTPKTEKTFAYLSGVNGYVDNLK